MTISAHERATFLRFLNADRNVHGRVTETAKPEAAALFPNANAEAQIDALGGACIRVLDLAKELLDEDVPPRFQISALAMVAGALGGRWSAAMCDVGMADTVSRCFTEAFNAAYACEREMMIAMLSEHEAGNA